MPDVNKLHVVTYLWRPGEAEADVVAHQVLATPANVKAGVEGDATKAVLSQAQNYQCHGEASAEGCTKCHGHAEERVIARLIENDRVAVAWRKYHPLAAKGTVSPGKPFEAEHDGIKVRVEARVVTDDEKEVLTPTAVSMVALRNLDLDLDKKHARAEQREQLRTVARTFVDGPLEQTRAQLAQILDRTKDLPGAAKTLKPVEQALDAIADEVSAALAALLAKAELAPADQQALTVQVQQATAKLAPALAPAQQLEANARELVALQGEIRQVLADLAALEQQVAAHHDALPGLDVKALPGAGASEVAEDLLEKTRTDASLAANDARAALAPIAALLAQRQDGLAAAVTQEQQKHAVFQERVDRLTSLKDGTLKAQLLDYAESCAAAPGFNLKYWMGRIDKSVAECASKAPAVDGLQYHKPADTKKLDAAEAKVASLTGTLGELDADVKKRLDAFPVHAVRGVQLTPPSIWLKVDAVHPNGTIDVTVNVRNNGAHALVLDIKNEDGSVVHKSLALTRKGEKATFSLAGVAKRFSFTIAAVGAEAQRGQPAQLMRCVVSAVNPIGLEGKGALRHVLPLHFTPAARQPNDAVAQAFADDGVRFTQQRLPGGG